MLRLILPLLFLAIQSALVIGRSQHICTLDIVKGPCMAYEKRYAFNTTSRQCQQFIYGGCQDNGNNFPSFDQCREVCQNECTLPKDTGSCKALFYHYYYNKETNKCEEFGYGGCEGNANNFKSKKECEAHCVITNPPE